MTMMYRFKVSFIDEEDEEGQRREWIPCCN